MFYIDSIDSMFDLNFQTQNRIKFSIMFIYAKRLDKMDGFYRVSVKGCVCVDIYILF